MQNSRRGFGIRIWVFCVSFLFHLFLGMERADSVGIMVSEDIPEGMMWC